MTLGEFRKKTAHLLDDIDIVMLTTKDSAWAIPPNGIEAGFWNEDESVYRTEQKTCSDIPVISIASYFSYGV